MAERQRDKKKESFWRDALQRHARSGLSVRAFCQREKLSESGFYAWRQTIRQRDQASDQQFPAPTFVPARVTSPASSIVVELSGGCTLRLPESMAIDRIAQLVSALERRGAR
jgi:transposase